MLPDDAWIVAVPCFPVMVAVPMALIVAISVFDELHATPLVISRTVPSPKVPLAENCKVPCEELTVGFVGVTARAVKGDVTTVTVVEPAMPPELAEIVADP